MSQLPSTVTVDLPNKDDVGVGEYLAAMYRTSAGWGSNCHGDVVM